MRKDRSNSAISWCKLKGSGTPYHHYHHPSVKGYLAEDWQGVYEGYQVYEQHASDQRLVVEKL